MKRSFISQFLLSLSSLAWGQGGLNPADILKPLSDQWSTYSGDYSGKRYSALKQIDQSTVKNLSLAWVTRFTAGCGANGGNDGGGGGFGGGGRGGGGVPAALIVGGLGTGDLNQCGAPRLGGGILMVDGILYMSAPDNAWAVDARDGTILWHYYWKTRGGTHTGNRGMGLWHNNLYLEVHDDFVICLDARTGREKWKKEISSFDQQYFSSMAPIVVGDHILVGTGNDLDAPGFLQSLNPETGEREWIFYTVPMTADDPAVKTWASLDAAIHGGGNVWIPGAYDPETHLYMFGTGNPTPAYTNGRRGDGDNLYTCSLVAVNVDTGKMAWYYQTSPHDTHDWDSTQTPVIADMPFNGRARKIVMTAERNGYFFVLDRVTGEHLITGKFGMYNNWALGLDEQGRPKRNPGKDATVPGSLVNGDVTNYPPPAFSPETGLFYVPERNSLRIMYLIDLDPRGSQGLGGAIGGGGANYGTFIDAIDYRTGEVVWRHEANSAGLLATAGGLLFSGDGQNLVAYEPKTGKPLWHAGIGPTDNAPETYLLDGKQYILATGGDQLFAFVLNH